MKERSMMKIVLICIYLCMTVAGLVLMKYGKNPGSIKVDDGNYFVAVGAAMSEEARPVELGELKESIKKAEEVMASESRKADFVLFEDEQAYEEFKARHDRDKVPKADMANYHGPIYVGIDAGSTTTKAALIKCMDRCNNLTSMAYGMDRKGIYRYIKSTEEHYPDLLKVLKTDYSNPAWILSYHIKSMLDIYKRLM